MKPASRPKAYSFSAYPINNAGRRAIEGSYDRFHNFERIMQLNYFGSLRVTMGLLTGMTAKKNGYVVNINSIGVLSNETRFSDNVAAKAALHALCLQRVCRRGRVVHHYQHAAGAHPHDCAHRPVRQRADAVTRRSG